MINSEKCIAYEYPFGSEKTGLAIIDIKDRYSDSGSVLNRVFEEIILVLDGRGKIIVEGKGHIVKKMMLSWFGQMKNIIMKVI